MGLSDRKAPLGEADGGNRESGKCLIMDAVDSSVGVMGVMAPERADATLDA